MMRNFFTLKLIGRKDQLFKDDLERFKKIINEIILNSTFLVIGGAGSIGSAVVKEIFKRNPKKLHVVDINENSLAEIVRDIRSSYGYIDGEFKTFAIDVGGEEFDAFWKWDGDYDFILNLSALKHVRSEKDPFTLMRMIEVNILNTEKTLIKSIEKNTKKYFCVSTDKATNPVNMMGASKRIMELFLMRRSLEISVSTARFANVAFSDGSLLHSFEKRIEKIQPIVAPSDVKRYFITQEEAGLLCLVSCLFGDNRDIFFPKLKENFKLISFTDIALKFIESKGYEPYLCKSEEEARELAKILPEKRKWPCFFTQSDTTGEKPFEEFFTKDDVLDLERFEYIGVIKSEPVFDSKKLNYFISEIKKMKKTLNWTKEDIVKLFEYMLPEFKHEEKGKYLDEKM